MLMLARFEKAPTFYPSAIDYTAHPPHPTATMSQHITNPLASPEQLASLDRLNPTLSPSDREIIYFTTSRLTQYASSLLKLSQSVGAQCVILLQRYFLTSPLLLHDFADISAAILYTTAKTSAHPRSLRSICNVYKYLEKHPNPAGPSPMTKEYYVTETAYASFTQRILLLEGIALAGLGFNLHASLPHPLVVTYAQALDLFGAGYPKGTGPQVAARAVRLLNTALLSPQLLYLTHQPNALAVSALYLAARQLGVSLPDEWWEVWDLEREDLGFIVVGMLSTESWAHEIGVKRLENVAVRRDFDRGEADEEEEMARMLDRR